MQHRAVYAVNPNAWFRSAQKMRAFPKHYHELQRRVSRKSGENAALTGL